MHTQRQTYVSQSSCPELLSHVNLQYRGLLSQYKTLFCLSVVYNKGEVSRRKKNAKVDKIWGYTQPGTNQSSIKWNSHLENSYHTQSCEGRGDKGVGGCSGLSETIYLTSWKNQQVAPDKAKRGQWGNGFAGAHVLRRITLSSTLSKNWCDKGRRVWRFLIEKEATGDCQATECQEWRVH